MNKYNVDTEYFQRELTALLRTLPDRKPAELRRYLERLADVALPPVDKISAKRAIALCKEMSGVPCRWINPVTVQEWVQEANAVVSQRRRCKKNREVS